MSTIQFYCPNCPNFLEVDEIYRGCQVTCPSCGTQTTASDIAPVVELIATPDPAPNGQPDSPSVSPATVPSKTDLYAVMSFVCSILGVVLIFCVFFVVLMIPGIVFGHVSLSKIKNSEGQLGGKGLASAGLFIGYVLLFLTVAGTIFFLANWIYCDVLGN